MKDTELRGLLLQVFYQRRRESWFLPKPADLPVPLSEQDILQLCDQLAEHGMLEWRVLKGHGTVRHGMGKINAFGIDVAEQVATPDIKVEFVQNQTVNISGSTNVVVGNNSQVIAGSVRDLVAFIESSNGSAEEKLEAKNRLRKFLEHPLLAAAVGGAIALLG
jgi:hypothetical protein